MKSFAGPEFDVNMNRYWKQILKSFLDVSSGIKIYKSNSEDCAPNNVTFLRDSENELFEFADKSGYLSEIKKVFENNKESLCTIHEDYIFSTIIHTEGMFSALEDCGYLKSNQAKIADLEYTHWLLAEKGIDVALKLQEHLDNDKRHGVTVSFSKKAFWVSVSAILVSIGALSAAIFSAYLNFKRLDLYELQVNKMVAGQAAILKEVKEPKKAKK